MQCAPVEVQFWLLAPAAQAGMIIGRGGDVIRRIRSDTEARVKVHAGAGSSRPQSGFTKQSRMAM